MRVTERQRRAVASRLADSKYGAEEDDRGARPWRRLLLAIFGREPAFAGDRKIGYNAIVDALVMLIYPEGDFFNGGKRG